MRGAPRLQRIPRLATAALLRCVPRRASLSILGCDLTVSPPLAPGQGSVPRWLRGLPGAPADLCPGRHDCPVDRRQRAQRASPVPPLHLGGRSLRGQLPPAYLHLLAAWCRSRSRLGDHRRRLRRQGALALVHLQPHQRLVDRGRDRGACDRAAPHVRADGGRPENAARADRVA